ncbi:MAG: hypothetical protein LBH60_06540 [Prevotellaceae bacterium]|jgi:hypothetical protein|nr:hypothetical protein [Prevotellaceae bacterium]
MKRILSISVLFTCIFSGIDAQDLITKKDGVEIRAKVVEISQEAVKYRIYDNPTGPLYVLPRSEIFMIKYEGDGRTELFVAGSVPETEPTPQSRITPVARTPVTMQPYRENWKDKMQTYAPDLYRTYRRNSGMAGFGIGLMAGGVAAIIVGVAVGTGEVIQSTSTYKTYELTETGAAIVTAGSLCIIAGTPLTIVGFVKRARAKRQYFSQYGNMTHRKSPLQYPHLELRSNGLAFVF